MIISLHTRINQSYLITSEAKDMIMNQSEDRKTAKVAVQKLLNIFQVADVNKQVLNFKDFEDGVQYYSGKCSEADCLLTRNPKDYKNTKLPVYTPTELWNILPTS